ncbi:hypothetical protein GBA52_028696 [Prunus armeniaca]|nr:hypothetical protein GBA52_028696 [Prunus armeniaca]
MEILIEDIDKFHEKVVGSVVRIRISSGDQKQEIYRLVQVIGTSKVAEPYKIGTRTTDVKLEILNLDKKEVISIDEISNQEFTQDECKRLRQSIRCGLTKRLTVGEIQEKAMALQAVRVNDLLEAEVLRLNHLRDRASEKGHRKEYPFLECVEKLQLLNSSEERQRRLHETQEVHPDPSMDPSYESEDSAGAFDKKQGEESWNSKQDGQSLHNNGNVEPVRCTTPVDVVNSNEEQTGNHLQGQDPLKGNSSSPNKAQESVSLPSPVVPVKPYETLEGESRGAENNSDQNNGNLDPPKTAQGQIMNGQCTENRSDSEGHSGQSSGQNWRPPPVSSPSNGCDSNSDLIPLSKSCETSEQDQRELSFPDIPSPTPKPSNGDLLGQAAENKQSVSSNFPVQDSGPSWSTASSLGVVGHNFPK